MQPAYVLAANMFAAVACPVGRQQRWLHVGSFNQELLPAATFKADEPERSGIDTMSAHRQKATILMNRRFYILECRCNRIPSLRFHGNGASFLFDDHVVFKETGCVLTDRSKGASRCGNRRAVDGVSMAHGDDVRMCLVHRRMQHVASAVDCIAPFDDLALMIHQ